MKKMLKNLIVLFFVIFGSFTALNAEASTVTSSQMGVCSRNVSANNCLTKTSSYINVPTANTYSVVANIGRGTNSLECQAHEDFDLYIDHVFYASSIDPDSCEPGTTNIYKNYSFPSITLSTGSHKISMIHRWADKASTGHLESVYVQLTFGTPPPPPTPKPSCSLSAQPSSINKNQNTTLSWSSNNITSVSIDNGVGNVSTSGSKTVTPLVNTTYTGTFKGPYGNVTCKASVTVIPPDPKSPVCSMGISKSSIEAGESANLSWNSNNITAVSIDHGVGSVSTTGSSNVFPLTDTTYTGTFTGPDGTVTCHASIEVVENPEAPSCSLGVNPSTLSPGQHATLYWSSVNISTTTIDNSIGLVNNSGAISVNPSHNTTYTGTFKGKDKTITCSATVTLGGGGVNPPSVSLSSNTFETEPSFIYLSQIPYTGVPEFAIYLFRILFFGGLLYAYYRLSERSSKLETK